MLVLTKFKRRLNPKLALRGVTLSVLLVMGNTTSADVVSATPAPFAQYSVDQILEAYHVVSIQLSNDLETVRGDNEGIAMVYGKHMLKVFELVGYDLDSTVFAIVNSASGSYTDRHAFARAVHLEPIIARVANREPGFAEGLLKIGALSERTILEIENEFYSRTIM